ncbi:hypothetical protein PG994_003210 [Apiospora phragmitis]|uniref:Rhodopsin domain-containing protein n=1 Tax=Apiospora phragmitis TaxID=2905665 RepID=A0ABR1VXH4_9PEZI
MLNQTTTTTATWTTSISHHGKQGPKMSATSPPPLPGAGLPDEYRGDEILGAVIATTSMAFITVCARLWVRLTMVHKMGSDDYAMIIAMTLSLAGLGVVIPQVVYGAGRHIAHLRPDAASMGLKINFVSQVVYLWAIPAVKMSIGLFLLRIAPNKGYRRVLQGVMLFTMAYTMMCFVTLLLQCTNLAILWDPTVQTTCWSRQTLQTLSYANSIVNILTDMFFAVLPIPMLWNVQINLRTKASLICIMGLGVFAVAAAIVKSFFISNYGKTVQHRHHRGLPAVPEAPVQAHPRDHDAALRPQQQGLLANQTDRSYKMKPYGSSSQKGGGGSHGSRQFQPQNQSKIGRASSSGRVMMHSSSKRGSSNTGGGGEDELALTKEASRTATTKVTTVTVDTSHRADSSWWSPTSPRMRV